MSLDKDKESEEKFSFNGVFSLNTWKDLAVAVRTYFAEHEGLLKLTGINVAIAGLLLNLESEDLYLKRLEVFFLMTTSALIIFFILKSISTLFKRGKYKEPYSSIVLFPIYIGVTIIYNLGIYLYKNFSTELVYYLHVVGIPLIFTAISLTFLGFFKFFSKFRQIEGSQIKSYFLTTLSLVLVVTYAFNDYSFIKMFHAIFSINFSTLLYLYLFFVVLFSEVRSFSRKRIADKIIFTILIALPFLVYYLLPRLLY